MWEHGHFGDTLMWGRQGRLWDCERPSLSTPEGCHCCVTIRAAPPEGLTIFVSSGGGEYWPASWGLGEVTFSRRIPYLPWRVCPSEGVAWGQGEGTGFRHCPSPHRFRQTPHK